jgi:hypothetical protein
MAAVPARAAGASGCPGVWVSGRPGRLSLPGDAGARRDAWEPGGTPVPRKTGEISSFGEIPVDHSPYFFPQSPDLPQVTRTRVRVVGGGDSRDA